MPGLYKTAVNAVNASKASLRPRDSEQFWHDLADKHGVWLPDLARLKDVPLEHLDAIAETLIHKAERTALLQGVSLGFGGVATILPDASFLSAILLRLTQRLSLLYGIDNRDENKNVEMWKFAATAAGVDYTKELAEKHLLRNVAPQIADRLARRVGTEVAAKWASRFVPFASSAIGGAMNFSLVRAWGRRMQREFREHYLSLQPAAVPVSFSVSEPIRNR